MEVVNEIPLRDSSCPKGGFVKDLPSLTKESDEDGLILVNDNGESAKRPLHDPLRRRFHP
jgi:hypothetical protein